MRSWALLALCASACVLGENRSILDLEVTFAPEAFDGLDDEDFPVLVQASSGDETYLVNFFCTRPTTEQTVSLFDNSIGTCSDDTEVEVVLASVSNIDCVDGILDLALAEGVVLPGTEVSATTATVNDGQDCIVEASATYE